MNKNQITIQIIQPRYTRLEYYDPSTLQAFQSTLEGKVLFYIAIAFSVFQVVTAAHLLDLPSQILRAVHVGFLGLLSFTLSLCIKKTKRSLFKIISWIAGEF